jgi:hypothetical protein
MGMRPIILVLLLLAAACGSASGSGRSQTSSGPGAGLTGTVTVKVVSGPSCPVVRDDNDPQCRPRPVDHAELSVRAKDGTEAATLTVVNGRAAGTVAPGSYLLMPQRVAGLMGVAKPVPFRVAAGQTVHLEVVYDTGIR